MASTGSTTRKVTRARARSYAKPWSFCAGISRGAERTAHADNLAGQVTRVTKASPSREPSPEGRRSRQGSLDSWDEACACQEIGFVRGSGETRHPGWNDSVGRGSPGVAQAG